MAYSTSDFNSFPYLNTSAAVGNLGTYQNSGLMAGVEATSFQPFDHAVNLSDTIECPNPTLDPPPSILSQHAYDGGIPPNSYPTLQNGYFQPAYPSGFQEFQPQTPFYGHGMWPNQQGWEEQARLQLGVSFPSVEALQGAQAAQYPSSVPLGCQGYNPSGFPVGIHQSGTGLTRTELSRGRRSRPYATRSVRPAGHTRVEAGPSTLPPLYRVHSTEHVHMEAGPSRLVPPQPPGGTPATTADAENDQKFTEEEKAPTSKRTRVPRVKDTGCLNSTGTDKNVPKLIKWAERRKGRFARLSFHKALAVALKDISTVREAVYEEPHLYVVSTGGGEDPSEYAIRERKRREAVRGSYEQLSRYYLREEGVWVRPQLLAVVVQDLETNPELRLS